MCRSFISIILLPLTIIAQSDDIQFEYLSSDDGLSSSIVWSLTQDKTGFMWFGTANGLNKYDGYKFTAYTHNPFDSSGLSDNNITALYADRSGYVWIGTFSGGLNRYDTRNDSFICFRHDPNKPNSISSNCIFSICQDKKGNLWIGTGGSGVNQLIYDQDSLNLDKTMFKRYYHEPANQNSIAGNFINDIFSDSKGTIWIGTSNGLSRLIINEKDSANIKNYGFDAQNSYSLSHKNVSSLCEDGYGNLWIGTSDGLYRLRLNDEKFYHYKHEPDNEFTLSQNDIKKIQIDHHQDNILWIGTTFGGINKFDIHSVKVKRYESVSEYYLHQKNFVVDMHQDATGMFWVSIWGGGVCKFDPQRKKFNKYLPGFGYGKQEVIWGIYENPNSDGSVIWLISINGGVLKFDRRRNTFKRFLTDPSHPNHKFRDMLYSLYGEPKPDNDSESILWLGCYAGGLMQFDCEKEQFNYILDDPTHILSNIKYRVTSIYPDPRQKEIIWFGTNSGGILRYDKKRSALKQFNHQPDNPLSLSHSFVESIMRDRAGNLWIGTRRGGLNRMNEENETFIHYKHDPADSNSISHNEVVLTFESHDGILWISTSHGLNKFIREKNIFQHYSIKDGLPSNYIFGIFEDRKDHLWLTTTKGLSRFNPKVKGKNAFRNYDVGDGLHGNEFDRKAFFQSKTGEIYAGGHRGFIIFHPDSIRDNTYEPPVILTDFFLFNKPVRPGIDSPLQYSITQTREINLQYDQNSITFEFAALDYLNPSKNKYAYKMEGIDRDWIYTDASRRFASYTQLDPGEYIFRVKGSNNDGIWNEEGTSIKIIITPPWWRTIWAYAFYVIIIAVSIYTTLYLQLRRIRLKHQLEMEHMHAEKLEEVDRMKSRFFANISHEFRTPLTLILTPIQGVLAKIRDVGLKNELKIIMRNANHLENLVNQLLDLSRLEAGKMKIQVQKLDIIPLLRKLVLAFTSLAERKKISLKYRNTSKSLLAYIDKDKIEKIINNLLSNAFKFTPEGGKIVVDVSIIQPPFSPFSKGETNPSPLLRGCNKTNSVFPVPNSDLMEITVTNTGPGIPTDKIDKIFDRFYQVDDSYTRNYEGTGIGLSLVKEMVELHHGTITVKCTSAATVFTFQLPLDRDHYAEDEIIESTPLKKEVKSGEISEELPVSLSSTDKLDEKPLKVSQEDKPLILLIEDNGDMRKYISDNLKNCYRLIEAVDGWQGWDLLVKKIPDLVISDIMMPGLDGFQVCEKIKNDVHTSHIPVILLTARAEMTDKIKGLETGADDYIPKPFVIEEIQVRAKNLIEQRQNLRQRFSSEALFGIQDISLNQTDERFLQHAMETIHKNIDNPRFTVQMLGDAIGMNRMTLHLKLKALSNQSPHSFIRLLRLKKAAVLLKQKTTRVTDVAYEVGFKSLSHFAKAFKEQFGETPSQFSANH